MRGFFLLKDIEMTPKYTFARASIVITKAIGGFFLLIGIIVFIAGVFGATPLESVTFNGKPANGAIGGILLLIQGALIIGFAEFGNSFLDRATNSFEILEVLKRQADAAEAANIKTPAKND